VIDGPVIEVHVTIAQRGPFRHDAVVDFIRLLSDDGGHSKQQQFVRA
jgi:hypothetical protein